MMLAKLEKSTSVISKREADEQMRLFANSKSLTPELRKNLARELVTRRERTRSDVASEKISN